MSSIDLVILGILMEGPRSAYDIQKDVEYHHFPRWTKISTPSVYKKVLQLKERGYLASDMVKGERLAEKAVYSVTESGRAYFNGLWTPLPAGGAAHLRFQRGGRQPQQAGQAQGDGAYRQAAREHRGVGCKEQRVRRYVCGYTAGGADGF